MKQYNAIKVKYPDAMLLFRVGDFYETFGEDAKKAAHVLGITLTKRGAGSETETALAGFPHHSINTYLPKLVKAGMRVAICDQLEDPKMTKTIVKRGVTELVTPGVALNDEVLHSKTNNFLAAVHFDKKQFGISFLDVSTGEYLVAEGNAEYIDKLLQNFNPSEVLVEKKNKQQFFELFENRFYTFYLEDWVFQPEYAQESLQNHFDVKSLKGFGIQNLESGIVAAGAILFYLSETQHKQLSHIQNISRIAEDNYVWMDRFTVRNLELYHGTSVNSVTLLDIIDATISPMGGRLLKRWLALPLKNKTEIEKRHETVNYLINSDDFFETVTYQIKQISDIERLISKVATGKASPREVVYLKNSLQAILPIKEAAEKSTNASVKQIGKQLNACTDLIAKITETLFDDAPVNINKGNAIASNVSNELDDLRAISNSGKEYLDNMLARETEQTGITSLKIAFNNVFGYYIEVRNTHRDKVPEEWIRKQTLVNAERYITEELK
ncbi:MAG: DNA mismatch repair protein MutS, partial [Polaribacter sp.]|nr:DNA mismatch repair protein MutS [Polaribacter sp.]